MKYLGKNIINSDDVSLVNSTEETLTDVLEQIELLRGNVKWLYAHTKNVNMHILEIKQPEPIEFITQEAYDTLVSENKIDPETIYLIEEE